MSLSVGYHTHSTQIVSTSNHAQVTSLELDEFENLSGGDIQPNGVVHFDQRIRVPDGSTVMCDEVWDTFASGSNPLDATEFVAGFNWSYAVEDESAFDVVENPEKLLGSFNRYYIYIHRG